MNDSGVPRSGAERRLPGLTNGKLRVPFTKPPVIVPRNPPPATCSSSLTRILRAVARGVFVAALPVVFVRFLVFLVFIRIGVTSRNEWLQRLGHLAATAAGVWRAEP